jgi:hypothetical protein
MIYYFTRDQWDHIWDDMYPTTINRASERINYWNKHLQSKYNLIYTESLFLAPDVYGSITGDEKYINWFLLQL